ncbi:ectoine/hydroxyectoine ABC transporter permease subunit EhuD [Paenibacillus agaridevorans]|uniref:Ectoine/hydroxyectoine ABC transporter permease subunit EhuD n=1 Tax=Paenibacillus agaridevorans TaxID=171404 RepID=A0A2R5EMS3_9BACL|nr:ectoine/hydroxyectoine ABC transporter permease subunit EhuD [Paenibacillus agaridevorans]GBG07942.1 ectoine/hydroxyectoine ABC transporter permease subunit EhuD [Paenibacillus agaridevorans]
MWDWDYVYELLPKLLRALPATLGAALCGFALAVLVGILIAIAGRSRFRLLRGLTTGIVDFIRSTPLLVQLFFLYYSLPMLTPLAMSAFATGVIGLGLHYACYLSEVFRSSIDALPKGQWEAASALNLSKARTWFSIVLPQAMPPVIPIMGNYLIVIFKETPALSAITFVELLMRTKNETSISFRAFEPYTITGGLFIVVSLLLSLAVSRLEKRFKNRTTA